MYTPLEYGKYYHIYNRGNNKEDIFLGEEDYRRFLNYFEIFTHSIANIFAWCLLKNHLHVLLRIKEEKEIGFLDSDYSKSENYHEKWSTYFPTKPDKRFTKKPKPICTRSTNKKVSNNNQNFQKLVNP